MAEMREIIMKLREELKENHNDFNTMAMLAHYVKRFKEEYGEYNLK